MQAIVRQALQCSKQAVLEKIAALLEVSDDDHDDDEDAIDNEHFYASGQTYQWANSPFDDEEHQRWYAIGDWHNAAMRLIHSRRFLNETVRQLFAGILQEALAAGSIDDTGLRPVVKNVLPDFEFFRARGQKFRRGTEVFDEARCRVGSPTQGTHNKRQNEPAGIPFLYVAEDQCTAVAEVRPSVGDTVVVGKFKATQPLKIFDLTAFSGRLVHEPLSLYDLDYETRSHRRTLLGYLHAEISRPSKTNDTHYLMTQTFTEYIRFECNEEFDGIGFRSVQNTNGTNYVLFDTASENEWT